MKGILRFALTMEYGVQSVTTAGAMPKLLWPADNWATQAVVMFNVIVANAFFQFMQTLTSIHVHVSPVAVPYQSSAFGQRFQPMEFGGLQCTGTESSLQECSVYSRYVVTWSKLFFSNQRHYSGVKCIPRSTGK